MEEHHKWEVLFCTVLVLGTIALLLWEAGLPPKSVEKPANASDNLAQPAHGLRQMKYSSYRFGLSPLPAGLNIIPVVAIAPSTDPRQIGATIIDGS